MKTQTLSVIAILFLIAAPAQAASGYRTASTHQYGNSHNDYHASASNYGPSHHDYNGKLTYANPPQYTGAPHYTDHPADYSTSPQALSASAAY